MCSWDEDDSSWALGPQVSQGAAGAPTYAAYAEGLWLYRDNKRGLSSRASDTEEGSVWICWVNGPDKQRSSQLLGGTGRRTSIVTKLWAQRVVDLARCWIVGVPTPTAWVYNPITQLRGLRRVPSPQKDEEISTCLKRMRKLVNWCVYSAHDSVWHKVSSQ